MRKQSVERTALEAVYQENNTPVAVCMTEDKLILQTADEHEIHVPLHCYTWLLQATPDQRQHFQMIASSIYWPDMDEGLSMESVLLGKYPYPPKPKEIEAHDSLERKALVT